MGWPREQFVHIPNFVDHTAFRPALEPGRAFVYFGRLSPEKGLRTLMHAASAARVPLRIIGDGPEASELRATAARLHADVTFTGRLEGAALWREVAAARATVLPSEWFENAPMTVLESYALGKPVIAAAAGGIPELVSDATGWLFPSGSIDALADILRSVADMPNAHVGDLGAGGRALVEHEYCSRRYLDRMTALYAELGVSVSRAEDRG